MKLWLKIHIIFEENGYVECISSSRSGLASIIDRANYKFTFPPLRGIVDTDCEISINWYILRFDNHKNR